MTTNWVCKLPIRNRTTSTTSTTSTYNYACLLIVHITDMIFCNVYNLLLWERYIRVFLK